MPKLRKNVLFFFFFYFSFHFYLHMNYNTNYNNNYQSIVEPNDTSASSISSIPALSVFSELGPSLDESRPLLTNSTQNTSVCPSIEDDENANATIASTSINLSNTILGTGMLAMVN
jgi:hypothetical protein